MGCKKRRGWGGQKSELYWYFWWIVGSASMVSTNCLSNSREGGGPCLVASKDAGGWSCKKGWKDETTCSRCRPVRTGVVGDSGVSIKSERIFCQKQVVWWAPGGGHSSKEKHGTQK